MDSNDCSMPSTPITNRIQSIQITSPHRHLTSPPKMLNPMMIVPSVPSFSGIIQQKRRYGEGREAEAIKKDLEDFQLETSPEQSSLGRPSDCKN
jgi:hypothetical protein